MEIGILVMHMDGSPFLCDALGRMERWGALVRKIHRAGFMSTHIYEEVS